MTDFDTEWVVVLRGTWYLGHLKNMIAAPHGNGEQNECRDEILEQIEAQLRYEYDSPLVEGTKAHPVVIHPDDREQVERLRTALVHYYGSTSILQAALRGFANPTPPKPDEPTGLGAVVEDAKGDQWVCLGNTFANGATRWQSQRRSIFSSYRDINAVRVLSEGVL